MIDRLLVAPEVEALERDQAANALREALDSDVRDEWRPTAAVWLQYLEALPVSEPVADAKPVNVVTGTRRAAPPFEPTTFPWGPVVLGGAGVVLLGAAIVTAWSASSRDSEIRRIGSTLCPTTAACELHQLSPEVRLRIARVQDDAETLYTATNVLLITGGISVAGAIAWYLLRSTPTDEQLSLAPWAGESGVGGRVHLRF